MARVFYLAKGVALDIPAVPARGARTGDVGYLAEFTSAGRSMNSSYEHNKDSIRFHYRCFDRILLNGLIQPFQQPERVIGFFDAYRHLFDQRPPPMMRGGARLHRESTYEERNPLPISA